MDRSAAHTDPTRRRAAVALCVLALFASACGGDDPDTASPDPAPTTADVHADRADLDTPTEDPNRSGTGNAGDIGSGDVGSRVVNLLDEPVDVHVRVGATEALVESSLAPGEVSEPVYPAQGGALVVTTAGAESALCIEDCSQVLMEAPAIPESGPVSTIVMFIDEGNFRSFTLFEQPTESRASLHGAMIDADPQTSHAIVSAVAYGGSNNRLAIVGASGCAEPVDTSNPIVGGTQTPTFDLGGEAARITLHDADDVDCATPVGGPFDVPGSPGSRAIVILFGEPGSVDAIVLPTIDD